MIITTTVAFSADSTHSFTFGQQEFLLDGKPFQIISGEIHPARVPQEYWKHRIQMAKAMGCNTIAAYIFWNYHESEPGVWDFETGNRDLRQFFGLVQEEGMWALLHPGPVASVFGLQYCICIRAENLPFSRSEMTPSSLSTNRSRPDAVR